jgi:undecaprenyl-diphosphatase
MDDAMTVQQGSGPPRRIERFTGRSLLGLVGLVVAGTLFGLMIILVRSNWEPLENLDHGAAAGLNDVVSNSKIMVGVLQAITGLGGTLVVWWVVLVGAVAMLIRRQKRLAAFLAVTGIGALILDPTIKILVGRLRPVVAHPVAHAPGNSFPSGHSLGSMVAYGSLLLVFLPAVRPRWRKAVVAAVVALIVLIGFSRVALGVHYVSDVIGAWLLGAAWLGATTYAFQAWRQETGRPKAPPLREGLEPESARAVEPTPDGPVRKDPDTSAGRAVGIVIVGLVVIFGLLVGLGLLVTHYTNGNFLGDRALPQWLAAHRTPSLTHLSQVFSDLGNTHWIMYVGLLAGPLLLFWSRHWRPALFLVVLMFGELALFLGTAAVVGRPRPETSHLDSHLPTSSFPSGHIAATICLYWGIFLLVRTRTRAWWGWLPLIPAIVMPVMVIWARWYRGMHHPTDALASVILSALWLWVLWYAMRPNADLERGSRRPRADLDEDREAIRAGAPAAAVTGEPDAGGPAALDGVAEREPAGRTGPPAGSGTVSAP